MKNKVLKAMACMMSVCMLSMSLAGCGNDDSGNSSTPGGSSDTPTSQGSSGGADESDAEQPSDEEVGIGADRSEGLFPAYDLGGITLTVLNSNNLSDKNPDVESLQPNDEDDAAAAADKAEKREQRQDLKDYIEAKYNVKLQFVDPPTSSWDDIPDQLVMNYTSGNPTADIMSANYQFTPTMMSNGMLYDFSNDLDGRFKEDAVFSWMGSVYGVGSVMGGEGLYYNKTMIKSLGMDYTPAEMFAMGQWSYDDCYNYLVELNDLMKDQLGEDAYPFYVYPLYWTLFAPAANGFALLDDSGVLNYCIDASFESFEWYDKICADGLCSIPATYDDDGNLTGYDVWNYPGNTFDKGELVAIAHRGAWQADSIDKSLFELGFVPYPWGSNVSVDESKVGQDDAYLSLNGYQQSCYDGYLMCLVNGIQEKADPMQVLSMVLEWVGWNSRMAAYEGGESANCGWLEDGLDKDLYFWSLGCTRMESWYILDGISFIPASSHVFYRHEESVRAALESAYNVDMQAMVDAGYISQDMFTPVEVEEE